MWLEIATYAECSASLLERLREDPYCAAARQTISQTEALITACDP
jgi:hypothetical protein